MLANFLNKSKPINFIGLLIFFVLLFFITSLKPIFIDGFSINKLLYSLFLLIILLCIFFFYNFIVSRNNLTFDNTYAYFLFTLFLICILSELTSHNILVLSLLNFLFLRKIYSLHSNKMILSKLFDTGFWVGISFIIEPLSVLFFIIVCAGIYLHQKITVYSILVPIVGFLCPIIIYFSFLFWNDKTDEFLVLFSLKSNFGLNSFTTFKYLWFIIVVFVLSFISIFLKSSKVFAVSNTFRNSWVLLVVNFFVAIIYILLTPEKKVSEIIFVLFPASIIIANGIELIKNKLIKNGIVYLFLIGTLFIYFSS